MTSAAPSAAAPASQVAAPEAEKIQVVYGYGAKVSVELHDLVARFTQEVQEQVSGDAESHYALGVSYLEMGLVDQAIESLRAAGKVPAFRASSFELIGRCLLDHGRFDEAVKEFHTALDHPSIVGDVALQMRFQLGLALEASGRLDEALDQFEIIYAAQPSFADAVLKIRVLKKALENE
jgi:tetratricopeptide (TPR) repeat protein